MGGRMAKALSKVTAKPQAQGRRRAATGFSRLAARTNRPVGHASHWRVASDAQQVSAKRVVAEAVPAAVTQDLSRARRFVPPYSPAR